MRHPCPVSTWFHCFPWRFWQLNISHQKQALTLWIVTAQVCRKLGGLSRAATLPWTALSLNGLGSFSWCLLSTVISFPLSKNTEIMAPLSNQKTFIICIIVSFTICDHSAFCNVGTTTKKQFTDHACSRVKINIFSFYFFLASFIFAVFRSPIT